MLAISQSIPHPPRSEIPENKEVERSTQHPQDGNQAKNSSFSSIPITPPSSCHDRNGLHAPSSFVRYAPLYHLDASTKYINAIAFDGGGIRGVISVKILAIIMDDLSKATDAEAHPANYFHMFGGTSTGGLIAMMLGRLRIPTETLLATYSDLSKDLFNSKLSRSFFQGRKYSGTLAEKLFAKIVADNSNEGVDTILRNTEDGAPGVFVTAVNHSDLSGEPIVIRSYEVDGETNSRYSHRIFDAARATTAAPWYFPAKTLGNGNVVVDGGLAVNNPTELLIDEAKRRHGRGVRFGLLLSIGTGEKAPMEYPAPEGLGPLSVFRVAKAFGDMLTDSEKTHKRIEERFRETDLGTYLRINVPDLGNVGLDDYKSIPDIVREVEKYMNTPEMKEMREQIIEILLHT